MSPPRPDLAATIRRRTSADLGTAAAALVEVHRTDGYPVEGVDDPRAWLVDDHQLAAWVAELGGQIVVHVALSDPQPGDAAAVMWGSHPDSDGAQPVVLGRLFVLRDARGHALGGDATQLPAWGSGPGQAVHAVDQLAAGE